MRKKTKAATRWY